MDALFALPVVNNKADAAYFKHHADAYPEAVAALRPENWSALCDFAVKGDPMAVAVAASIGVAVICAILGPLTRDYSWIDRLWSILPPAYVAYFAFRADFADTRLTTMLLLTLVWGGRLSYNFFRKGGYKVGHEDYRWPILRQRISPWMFQIFNIVFIAFYQSWLLMMIAAPCYVCWRARGQPISLLDILATVSFVFFFLIEIIADEQQWIFHAEKRRAKEMGIQGSGDVRRGFLTQGLFAYSRHPNFFAEQCLWWIVYLFSVAASGLAINWAIAGAALLSMLFQGSTAFTEDITSSKYPLYRFYQKTTSRLLPGKPGTPLDDLRLD